MKSKYLIRRPPANIQINRNAIVEAIDRMILTLDYLIEQYRQFISEKID